MYYKVKIIKEKIIHNVIKELVNISNNKARKKNYSMV